MLTVSKEFHFSASHVLDRLPSAHPCARMHGHNYIVVLELSATRADLTEAGFVRDYRELDVFKKWMDDTLDHRHLNEAVGAGISPSAENLAVWIFDHWIDRFPELAAVRISETPKPWAEYRPKR
ncbi:6-carboxytetrahydropterin synthase [Streptomyces sp. NPDC048664]|uniref:6-pyruvoyl trahydropterin synthase family protein n=1 Tax=Streptomyces sp. NPDC048664 TaxID=3154505 RepID=UPI00342A1BE4